MVFRFEVIFCAINTNTDNYQHQWIVPQQVYMIRIIVSRDTETNFHWRNSTLRCFNEFYVQQKKRILWTVYKTTIQVTTVYTRRVNDTEGGRAVVVISLLQVILIQRVLNWCHALRFNSFSMLRKLHNIFSVMVAGQFVGCCKYPHCLSRPWLSVNTTFCKKALYTISVKLGPYTGNNNNKHFYRAKGRN